MCSSSFIAFKATTGRIMSSSSVTVRLTAVAASHKDVTAAALGAEGVVAAPEVDDALFPVFDAAGRNGAACADMRGVVDGNLVQESTFCTIMIWSTFYLNPISLKMMSRKFHASSSMAYLHKCPLDYTLPYGRSNFQSDFFAFLIADSNSLQKTA